MWVKHSSLTGEQSVIAIGKPVQHPLMLQESFVSARVAYNRHFYHPDQKLFIFEGQALSLDIGFDPTHEFSRMLLQYPNQVRQWVVEQFEYIRHYKDTPVELIRYWAFQMITELYLLDRDRLDTMINGLVDEATLWKKIITLTSLHQVEKFLLDSIDCLKSAQSFSDCNLPVVLNVQRYIRLHHADPTLTLEVISQHVNFSPTYLCGIFKEVVGQTINQYLTDCRMRRAQLLLQTTNMRIHEVALDSGYSSSSYFIKTFRKSTGVTPQEYRRNRIAL